MAINSNETLNAKKINQEAAAKYLVGPPVPSGKDGEQAQINMLNANGYKIGQAGTQKAPANGISTPGAGNAMTKGNAMTQSQNNSGIMTPKATVPEHNGLYGIRMSLNNAGVDVGWNDDRKTVTYQGGEYKPSAVIDGTSYASKQDIHSMINNAYKAKGDELVQATAYATNTGLENIVRYSDGKVYVGGTEVPYAYIDDEGKAMVSRSALTAALDKYSKNAGIIGDKGVLDSYEKKYGDRIEEALDKVINREKWSYDPYSDPAYLAYKNQYEREGNRAYQDAYASMAGGTGGYGNSAAVTAGAQQLNYYQQQLNDRVPELMQNDYYRYADEQQRNVTAFDALRAAGNDYYNKVYAANRDAYDRTNQALLDNYNRDNYQKYNAKLNASEIKGKELDNQSAQLSLTIDRYKTNPNVPIGAADAAAAGIPALSDGTYPSYKDIEMAAADIEAATGLKLWNGYGRIEFSDQAQISREEQEKLLWEQVEANTVQQYKNIMLQAMSPYLSSEILAAAAQKRVNDMSRGTEGKPDYNFSTQLFQMLDPYYNAASKAAQSEEEQRRKAGSAQTNNILK